MEQYKAFLVIAIIGYALASMCLLITIILYHKLNIPQVIKRLRTIPSKQKMAMKERNEQDRAKTNDFSKNAEQMGLFNFEVTGEQQRNTSEEWNYTTAQESGGQAVNPVPIREAAKNQTAVLQQPENRRAGTVVLNAAVSNTSQTGVLQSELESSKDFRVIKSIVLIHTSETI